MNVEGDLLEKTVPGSVQVSGSDSDEAKEEAYRAFAGGNVRVLVIKPKIGAWGLNWQHCSDIVTFASHSHEQFYQSVRRCWRFGQQRPVTVDIVSTEGEEGVRHSMKRKAEMADHMFSQLVAEMRRAECQSRKRNDIVDVELPSWA